MNLELYRTKVRQLLAARDGDAIYNGSADHAAIIVESLFDAANKRVRLLTGDLNARVYGASPVVERAAQFLGHADHTLEIIVEEWNASRSHPLVEEIGGNDNLSIYKLSREMSDKVAFHMMTADDDCFRFEREKNSHAAVAAFGDTKTTQHLNGLWDSLRVHSELLDKKQLVV
jgi:hypothetical protein